MTDFRLDGRVAVVTGGASGIGRASCLALAGAGASVVVADRDAAGAADVVAQVVSAGGDALGVTVDVADQASVDALADAAVGEFGRIDCWANVAGVMRTQYAVNVTEADFDAVLSVNLKGVLFGSQAAARVMTGQGSGSIVNVVSAIIDAAVPGMAGYAVSKAGATMLTKCLAIELGHAGVRVNAVAPGWTPTPMTRRPGGEGDPVDDETLSALTAKQARYVPMGRAAEADDVADTIVFLASDASAFTTGQIFRPHGGVTMPW